MLRKITRDDLRNDPTLAKKGKSLNMMHDFPDSDESIHAKADTGKKKPTRKNSLKKPVQSVKASKRPVKKAAVKKAAPKKAAPKKTGGKK